MTHSVPNTPCIFHNKKCFLSTSFFDAWTWEGSSAVPPTRNMRKWRYLSEARLLTICFCKYIINLNHSHLKWHGQKQYPIIGNSILPPFPWTIISRKPYHLTKAEVTTVGNYRSSNCLISWLLEISILPENLIAIEHMWYLKFQNMHSPFQ